MSSDTIISIINMSLETVDHTKNFIIIAENYSSDQMVKQFIDENLVDCNNYADCMIALSKLVITNLNQLKSPGVYESLDKCRVMVKLSQDENVLKFIKALGSNKIESSHNKSDKVLTPETPANEEFPGIKTMEGIFECKTWDNVAELAKKGKDKLYVIPSLRDVFYAAPPSPGIVCCISGSYALRKLVNELIMFDDGSNSDENCRQYYGRLSNLTFKNGDIDTYLLNQKMNHHYKIDIVDHIYSTAKTIEELIMDFDLPCNRVAIDAHGNYHVTAQCLYSIMHGKYFLPKEFLNLDRLKSKVKQDKNITNKLKENYEELCNYAKSAEISAGMDHLINAGPKEYIERLIDLKCRKSVERIKKYTDRGFLVEYIDLSEHILFSPRGYTVNSY